MIERRLGRTNYSVSAMGLGGFQFVGRFGVKPEEADSIIDYALAHKVNIIDTAQAYGSGESEAIIGRALLRHAEDRPIVCAKVGHFHQGILMGLGDKVKAAYLDYGEIMRTIKQSMWVLRVDHFDILMMHEVEREWQTDLETGDCVVMEVLEDLKKEGLAEFIGASSWDCSALAKMVRTGRVDVILNAGGISLMNRQIFDDLIPACKDQDVGVIVGASLGQNMPGLVVKNRERLVPMMESDDEKLQTFAKKINALYDISDELGLSMVQLVVRYVLSFEDIHSHTMGVREMAHIIDNIRSAEMGPLSEDVIRRIHEIQDHGETYSLQELAGMQRQGRLFK